MNVDEESNRASGVAESEIARIEAELARRFGGVGGAMARASSFAVLFPSAPPQYVEEALHRLWEQGVVESYCLADGALAYHFPPR
ncbi:MAG: hypothetical protein K0Q72_3105 [Armatimonadetes bacterium]|nr:hypothetical protein [Armatimonadota bacterium]